MTEQRVVRVSGPAELVAAVPYLVGYRPREALVVLALCGPRRRVGPAACLALPPRGRPDLVDDVVGTALGPVRSCGAERVLAVVYPRRRPASTGALPERAVASALRRAADAAGVEVEDVLAVWDDRWWSYLCRDARCCPPQGRPLTDPSTVAVVAAMVAEGAAPAASREALAASLDPAPGGPGEALGAALARRREEVAAEHGPVTRARTLAALERLLTAGTAGSAGSGPAPDRDAGGPGDPAERVDDVADLLVGLADVVTRDAALCVVADSGGSEAAEVLRPVLRVAPEELVAPVATVLAFAAYVDGDGALANLALDRALAADPAYALALLLVELLSSGAHPRLLRELVADIRAGVMPSSA